MAITVEDTQYPSVSTLINNKVASRIRAKDASLYDFSPEAMQCAQEFMGWVDLATNTPYPVSSVVEFAQSAIAGGIRSVLLIGEGGSTQAPMTITKYNKEDSSLVKFRVLDSDSPVRVRSIMTDLNPESMLVLVSSKSGTTIETRLMLQAVRKEMQRKMAAEKIPSHLVAITDPGTELEQLAREEGWRAIFSGVPSVGGRYSALSVFGLVPTALVGIDMEDFMAHAVEAERACSVDSVENPAIQLAAFLYDNYVAGRDKFSFLAPKRGRVLGLWIEQLVAESLGKEGKGILPNIEIDPLVLTRDAGDRTAIMYKTKTDLWDERKNFEMSYAYMNKDIPCLEFSIESAQELAEHFVMWEYAIAMCGYLMQVCPFDQPDVAAAKHAVLDILKEGHIEPDFVQENIGSMHMGTVEVRLSDELKGARTLEVALHALLASIKPGDYFALNAFLPFTGEGRREALETIRHSVAAECGIASCLEIGPRYLHSTGQLQKGGPNNGVFLIVSSGEMLDIELDNAEAPSLAALAKAQAAGDLKVLNERGRRCMHVHLPDNSSVVLRQLGEVVQRICRTIA